MVKKITPNYNQSGLTLVELAFAILIFSILIMTAAFGIEVLGKSKVKAMIIQLTSYKSASETFQKQYGAWPGDFAFARDRIKDCNDARECYNGNGDHLIAHRTSPSTCFMPTDVVEDTPFPVPCQSVDANNETAQFWRHLALVGLIEGITMRPGRYRWGDSMPKVRMIGGLQVLYQNNIGDYKTNGLRGHFFVHQRQPRVFHTDYRAIGDHVSTPKQTRMIDIEIDDGRPNTGMLRSVGHRGCGGIDEPNNEYGEGELSDSNVHQCMLLYKFDP